MKPAPFLFATAVAALLMLTAGCGGGSGNAEPARATPTAASQEAVMRTGDVTIRASVLPTAALAPEVASQYGIARDDRTLMLLVGVRKGPEAEETSLPAQITATLTHLSGQRRDIAMREVRVAAPKDGSGPELLDYVGVIETDLPDKLRFDLTVVREDGGTSTMKFEREFFPR